MGIKGSRVSNPSWRRKRIKNEYSLSDKIGVYLNTFEGKGFAFVLFYLISHSLGLVTLVLPGHT